MLSKKIGIGKKNYSITVSNHPIEQPSAETRDICYAQKKIVMRRKLA